MEFQHEALESSVESLRISISLQMVGIQKNYWIIENLIFIVSATRKLALFPVIFTWIAREWDPIWNLIRNSMTLF